MYTLHYFNARCGAETIRFIFHAAGVSFQDHRVEQEEWPELKNKLKWGLMPVLEFEGTELFGSAVIARYLAKKYNLTGEDELQKAKCDEYVDIIKDIRAEWEKFYFEEELEKQAEAKKALEETVFPYYFPKLENVLKENGTQWLVGSQHTWADFFLTNFVDIFLDTVDSFGEFLEKYPCVKANKDAVINIPGIKTYIEQRPKTNM